MVSVTAFGREYDRSTTTAPPPDVPQLVERPRCPVCAGAPAETLYRCRFDAPPIRDYLFRSYPGFDEDELGALAQGEYVLERCGTCSLIWQRFAPSEPLLERIYGAWRRIDGGVERHDNLHYQQATAEEILLLLELVQRRPSDVTVLDFGMGWGRWPRFAAAFGCRAFGVELGESQVEFARGQGIEVLVLEELPPAAFDFVNCEQVFEHLVEPRQTLEQLSRSLAVDGWLKINVPNGRPIPARLRTPDWSAPRGSKRSLNPVAPLEHLNCFNQRSLDALGEQVRLRRQAPGLTRQYASTIGLWPPRRLARAVARPPLRRLAPGATYFRHAGRS